MTDLEIVKKALDIIEMPYDVDEYDLNNSVLMRIYYNDYNETQFEFNKKGELINKYYF